jgi:hypothetical protein
VLPYALYALYALLTPAFEAPPHRRGCALVAREIPPPRARDEQVQDALDGATIVGSWPAATAVGKRSGQGKAHCLSVR